MRNLFYDRLEGRLYQDMMDVDQGGGDSGHHIMGIQRDQEVADNLVKRDKTLRECQVLKNFINKSLCNFMQVGIWPHDMLLI